MKIGNITLKHGLLLGPMAGYSDRAMREVCHIAGAEYAVSEMISAKALVFRDKKTPALAHIGANEGNVALQLFGREPDTMAEAARMLECGMGGGRPPVAIDINMGCPVHKIAGNGEGSALMREPRLAAEIVRAVSRAVQIPVTVKIRAGWSEKEKNAVDVARALEEAGAAAITVHARTREQLYMGHADYAVIADVKRAVSLPVIGNGDVTDGESALRLTRETGCDGIMVARGAVGNPYVFEEIAAALSGRPYQRRTLAERLSLAKMQIRLSAEEKGEYIAVRELRKQLLAYLRGLRGGAALRLEIAEATSIPALLSILDRAEALPLER